MNVTSEWLSPFPACILNGKMGNSRARAENIQDEPGASYNVRKSKSTQKKKNDGGMSKGHKRQLKGLPAAKARTI